MKKVLVALSLCLASTLAVSETKVAELPKVEAPVVKEVCRTKDGKKVCKKVKVHKKLDGKPVPTK